MNKLLLSLFLLAPRAASAAPHVVGTYPLSGLLGVSGAQMIAADTKRGQVWVGGYYSENLLVIDEETKAPIASLEGFRYLRDLAVDSARDRVYVSYYDPGLGYVIAIIDAQTRTVISRNKANYWYFKTLTVDPATGFLYMVSLKYNYTTYKHTLQLHKWDPDTASVTATYDFPGIYSDYSRIALKVSSDKLYAVVTQRFNLALVDANKYQYYTADYLSRAISFDKGDFSGKQEIVFDEPTWSYSLLVDEVGGRMYVPGTGKIWTVGIDGAGNYGAVSKRTVIGHYGEVALNADRSRLYHAHSSGLRVYDMADWSVVMNASFDSGDKYLAMDHSRGLAHIASFNGNSIRMYDLATDSLLKELDVRRDTPSDIDLDEASGLAYVATEKSRGVSVWDTVAAEEKKFLFSGLPVSGLAVFPSLGKGFLQYSSVFGWRMDLGDVKYPFKYVIGPSQITGKSKPKGGEEVILVQRNDGAGKGGLIFYDAATESSAEAFDICATTDYPKGVAANPASNKAYVALYGANKVAVVDLDSRTVIKRIPVGFYPEGVAADPIWNRIYVTNYGSNSVSVIDGDTDEVVATVPVGRSPRSVAVKKKGVRVYVANEADDTVSVIHGGSLKVVATLPVGGTPRSLQVDEGTERAYVANYSSASISVIEDIASTDTEPPVITHAPLAGPIQEGQSVVIEAQVVDDHKVAVVTLTFWGSADSGYTTVPMAYVSGNTYRVEISQEKLLALQGGEFMYFLDATDYEGNGPPAGSTPGTASHPNTVEVARTLEVAWSHAFGKVYGGFYRMTPGPSAAIGELRSDLTGLEIATGNEEYYPTGYSGPPGRWFVFTSNGTTALLKSTENDEAHSSVNLYDLDGDGGPEILGGTTSGNQIQAFDSAGKWLWKYVLGSHALSTPAVAPLAAGAAPRVFGGSFDNHLRSIEGKNGALNWSFPVSNWIWSSPAVADLDGDGKKEVVITSEGGTVFTNGVWVSSEGFLYCVSAESGALRWKVSLGDKTRERSSAALADLDDDGVMEVLIGGGDGVLRAYAGDTGAVKWSFTTGGEILSSPAVGDVDGDGKMEVVFGSGDGKLYALKAGGTLAWSRHLGSAIFSSPALARRAAGAALDIYVTTKQGTLYVVRGTDGEPIAGASVGAEVVSSPVVADVDGDGKLEVFFQDRKGDKVNPIQGDVFWAFRDNGSSVEPFAREWPMFRRDPAHTGVYPSDKEAKPDTTPPAYADFRSIGSTGTAVVESGYNDLQAGVTVQLTVQDVESGLSQSGFGVRFSSDAGQNWTAAAASLTGTNGATTPQTLSGHGLVLAETANTAVCGGAEPCAATNQVIFTVKDAAGNVRTAGPFAIRFEAPDAPPAAPVAVTGVTAEAPHMGGSLKLEWDANGESDIAAYKLYRDGELLVTLSSTSYSDEGLTDGTTYAYQVSAVNESGLEGEKSAAVSAVPADKLPPDSYIKAPSDKAVIHESFVTLSGEASDAGASGVAKIDISLYDVTAGEQQWLAAEGTTAFQLGLKGLEDGHSYQIASRATDAEGNVEPQLTIVSFTVDLAPAKVDGLTVAAAAAGGKLELSWNVVGAADFAGYKLYRNGEFLVEVATNNFSDSGLTDGTQYAYQVSAVDQAGQEGDKSDAVSGTPGDALAPVSAITSPADKTVFAATTLTLAGTAADAGTSGLEKIEVLLKDKTAGTSTTHAAAGTAAFSLELKDLLDGHAYEAASKARDKAGNQETTPAWISFNVDLAPAKVAGLAVAALAAGEQLNLTWNAASAADFAAYRLYRDGEFLALVTGTSYEDKGLTDGTQYAYQVSAVDQAGQEGGKSDAVSGTPGDALAPVSAITSPADKTVFAATTLTLAGTAADAGTSGLEKIEVLLKDKTAGTSTTFAAAGTAAFSLELKDLLDGHAYEAASKAQDKAGNQETTPAWISFNVDLPPAAVQNLKASPDNSGTSALLSWDPPAFSEVEGYRIYKGEIVIATASALNFSLVQLLPGKSYECWVSAFDAAGQEGPKTKAGFTTPNIAKGKAEIRIPKDGKKIWGNAVSILAQATEATVKVSFQHRYEAADVWTEIAADANTPFSVYWNVSDANISTGTYELRAVAYDNDGLADPAPATISVIVGDANADIVEDGNPSVNPNKDHKLTQKVAADLTEEILLADGTEILIPAGTVEEDEVLEIRSVQGAETPEHTSGEKLLKSGNVFRELTFASGKRKFDKSLVVTLPAPDENGDGILDGTDIPLSDLRAYYYDEQLAKWVPIRSVIVGQKTSMASVSSGGSSSVGLPLTASGAGTSSGGASVVFETDHFTLFGLFQEYAAGRVLEYDEVYTFPNPARSGRNPTFHIEAGAADKVDIHVYDVAGEHVYSKTLEDGPRTIDDGQGPQLAFEHAWDVAGVASGVYIYVITAHREGMGSSRKVGKCAVIK